MSKSELLVTAASPALVQSLAAQINCKPAQFPLTYLGLPLSDQQPGRAFFQQLVTKVQNKLQTWKASMLSIGGRLVLLNAVLTSLPVYAMSVFKLPKWTIKKLDQTRRTFLWHGHKERALGLNLISWSQVTLPKQKGGLGVKNLEIFNQALLMKWMWNWVQQRGSWWQEATPIMSTHVAPWYCTDASKFWRQMKELSDVFLCSITIQIGDGNRTSFWHDQWQGQALKNVAPTYYREFPDKWISVAKSWHDGQWNLPPSTSQQGQRERESLMHMLAGVRPNNVQDDSVQWTRSASHFTVKSAYNFRIDVPAPATSLKQIWQIKAPLRIQIFTWRMLKNRLPTIDNLVARGWHLVNWCQLCKRHEETMQHIFVGCPLAREFRGHIFDIYWPSKNISHLYAGINPHELLVANQAGIASRQIEMATNFILWCERCRRIFAGKELQIIDLVRELVEEVGYWFPREFSPSSSFIEELQRSIA